MSTLIGYTAHQETDSTGKVLQSLLLLVRNFLNPAEASIQPRRVWDSQHMPDVPSRVWRRHSALLTLLAQQAQRVEPHQRDAE